LVLEVEESGDPLLGVLVDPSVMDQPDRDRVEEVQLLPSRTTGDHEVGFLKHLEMLHDPESGHIQTRLQFGERAAVTLEEEVEKESPGWICQRPEHRVQVVSTGVMVVVHVSDNR